MIVFGADLYFAGVSFLFFPLRDLQCPSADRHEILHDNGKCVQFNNPGPNFLGTLTPKILEAIKMQNLA